MRLITLSCRMKHVSLWVGRACVLFIWPLFPTPKSAPFFSLTLPHKSGGTFVLRLGALMFVYQGKPERGVR